MYYILPFNYSLFKIHHCCSSYATINISSATVIANCMRESLHDSPDLCTPLICSGRSTTIGGRGAKTTPPTNKDRVTITVVVLSPREGKEGSGPSGVAVPRRGDFG